MPKYIGKTGNQVGHGDDQIVIVAQDAEEAMQKMLGYSVEGWPESDGSYDAVVWIEDAEQNVLAIERVTICPDGTRDLPC